MKKRMLTLLFTIVMVLGMLPVAMATDSAWDGVSKDKPDQVGDVYQINTGAKLAWFVDYYITETQPVSGVLTDDIDLGNHAWVATTNSGNGKSFVLDGQGHSVTGLNAKYGLIGAISTNSRIANLSVHGVVNGGDGATRVGGIAGFANGGTIENCVNYANITASNPGKDIHAGGIIGYCYDSKVCIQNCANYGSVICTGNSVGGIVGSNGKKDFKVIGCYNAGAVSGTKYVGGIVGNNDDKKSSVIGFCNVGNIIGESYVGGLLGQAKGNGSNNKITVSSCYSTGAVTGTDNTNALFGAAKNINDSKLYYLSSCGTDTYGTACTEAELKTADLDTTYFKHICGDYPALVWQTGVKEHRYCNHPATTTCAYCAYDPAPGADTPGAIVRTCQNGCGLTQRETVEPLNRYAVTVSEAANGTVLVSHSEAACGTTITITATPAAEYVLESITVTAADGSPVTVTNGTFTMPSGGATVTVLFKEYFPEIGITVPADAQVELSYKSVSSVKYYYESGLSALTVAKFVENADGTVTYYYEPKGNVGHIYRVTAEDGVTYVGFFTKARNKRVDVTVTDSQLHPAGKTAKTLDRDLTSNSGCNVADVFLNVNAKGYLNMSVNSTRQLYPLRNWQAIKDNSYMANAFVEPDYHYTVLDENGQISDSVVTVSDSGLLTAVGSGTAIVLVTYDAMTYEFTDGDEFFGAIWPENTGVFVVSVGTGSSDIVTGMTINTEEGRNYNNSNLAGDALDAELDVIYFLGDTGSYTFTPGTAGVTVSVALPTVTDKMTFNGFQAVAANGDGSFTVPLKEGRNIVKLEKDGKAEYQVITAKHVSVTINNGEPVKPGDELTITFSTLYHPANKLGAVYNGTAGAVYTAPDGTLVGSIVGGGIGVYNIASNATAQKITSAVVRSEKLSNWSTVDVTYSFGDKLTIPADYTGDTYTLRGGAMIAVSNAYCMQFGDHRTINGNADAVSGRATLVGREAYFGTLPDIVIPVARFSVTLPTEVTGCTVAPAAGAVSPLARGDSYSFTVTLDQDYREGRNFAVKANGVELTGVNGVYTITNIQEDQVVTVEGAFKDVTVPSTSAKPSTPSTPSKPSEPAKPADPVKHVAGFSDVDQRDWFAQSVQYICEKGLMNGTSSSTFSPNANTTRGMIVTILARLEGVNTNTGSSWYEAGRQWAMENGISDGTDMTGEITHEQLAAMLYRYAQSKGWSTSARISLSSFSDASSVSGWAQEAMQWAVAMGLIQGSDGQLAPAAPATRAQVAAILQRFIVNVAQ